MATPFKIVYLLPFAIFLWFNLLSTTASSIKWENLNLTKEQEETVQKVDDLLNQFLGEVEKELQRKPPHRHPSRPHTNKSSEENLSNDTETYAHRPTKNTGGQPEGHFTGTHVPSDTGFSNNNGYANTGLDGHNTHANSGTNGQGAHTNAGIDIRNGQNHGGVNNYGGVNNQEGHTNIGNVGVGHTEHSMGSIVFPK